MREDRIVVEAGDDRFGYPLLRFPDPDGLMLELIGSSDEAPRKPNQSPDTGSKQFPEPVGASGEQSAPKIQGFAPPTLQVSHRHETERLMTEILGFDFVGEEGNRRRFRAAGASAAASLDVVASEAAFGRIAAGTVHHIAFRAATDDEQLRWRDQLMENGYDVSPVMDRQHFHSIYFREPSGILFEIATDEPGFAIDESIDELGEGLKLPPMYESARSEIERALPPVHLPAVPAK